MPNALSHLHPSRALILSGAATALLTASPALAEDGLTLSGSVRLRYEAIDGQARAGFNKSDDLWNLRTILLAEYRQDNVRLGVELNDSRVWGGDAGTPVTTNEVNAFEPVQAYVAADFAGAFGPGTNLRLTGGRMTLNLGSRRLVASDDYRNTTNAYTGLRADIGARDGWKGALIYTLPHVRLPDDRAGIDDAKVRLDRESFDLVLWGGQISKTAALGRAMAEITYFHLGERDAPGRPTRDRSLDTFGGRVIADAKAGQLDYELEALYQTGKISASLAPTAADQSVSATFVHAELGYTLTGPWKPRVAVEFDRASGDKPGGKFGRFDTLFGMRRAELAPSGLYNAVGRANVSTAGTRVELTPSARTDLFVAYHALWLASRRDSFSTTGVRDASGRSGSFAGHQIEGRVRYWFVPERLRAEINGLLLAKGRFLQDAPAIPTGSWTRYVSLNLMASF